MLSDRTFRVVPLVMALACAAFGGSERLAHNEQGGNRIVGRFGGECLPLAVAPSTALGRVMKRQFLARNPKSNGWSEIRAHAIDLNHDGELEYFVPLDCGATGNCTWGVFADNPARYLGSFTAWFFFVERGSRNWDRVRTYTREGGDAGTIETWVHRRSRYARSQAMAEHGSAADPSPFLSRMGLPECP
jgi:hypothetical protein